MITRPKAKKDAKDRFLPNGGKAQAGLNRAILSSAWGQVVSYTTYEALRLGKLVITIPPECTSPECAVQPESSHRRQECRHAIGPTESNPRL